MTVADVPACAAGLGTVKITMITQGVPLRCARIYRLPSDTKLMQQWLAMAQKSKVRRCEVEAVLSFAEKSNLQRPMASAGPRRR
jgi:hypothetical protein